MLQDMASGKAVYLFASGAGSSAPTSANAAAGHFIATINPWSASTVAVPDFPDSMPLPPGLSDSVMLGTLHNTSATTRGSCFVRVYLVGSLNLAATGDQFTHAAATFPLTRTVMGQAAQPLTMIPFIRIKTATTTTPAVFRLRTAAGGAGYVDQDGNNVVGTKTITLPNAATATQGCYFFRLEESSRGVRDISAIEVTTAASAGTADVLMMEILSLTAQPYNHGMAFDNLMSGYMTRISPAVATSGTVSSALCTMGFTAAALTQDMIAWGCAT